MTRKTTATNEAKDEIEIIAETVGRYTRKAFTKAQDAGDSLEGFTDAIREEPFKAALIALGAGIVLGLIIRR